MPRPLVNGHNDPLHLQQLRLPRVDTDFRDFPLSRNEQMPLRSIDQTRLQNAAILTPLPADNANDFARWLSLDIRRRANRCGFLFEHISGILLVVLQNDLTRSGPLFFRQQFQSNDIAVHRSVEAISTLDQNLILEMR